MRSFKVVAITHKKAGLEAVGAFHMEDAQCAITLPKIKDELAWDELMYLSTCNRVEFFISSETKINLEAFLEYFPKSKLQLDELETYDGNDAVNHLFRVASSLDSMVVGEREIITQVRAAYEKSKAWGITGDNIRLAIRKTIEHAKRIFTETAIANHPVSVVSLAFKQFKALDYSKDAQIIMIGAGQTNRSMARFLTKSGWNNITVYNRTLANAQKLAEELQLKAKPLTELVNRSSDFDAIFTCTGAENVVLSNDLYKTLCKSTSSKTIVDLAVPEDTDPRIMENFEVNYLSVEMLKPIAEQNLRQRQGEMEVCEAILEESMVEFDAMLKERKVERAMSEVPGKVKQIKERALESVFADDVSGLDENSREVLEKVLNYVEKKYISVPMKMAKEIILDKNYEER